MDQKPLLKRYTDAPVFEKDIVDMAANGYGLQSWHPVQEQFESSDGRGNTAQWFVTVFYALYYPLPAAEPEKRGIRAR